MNRVFVPLVFCCAVTWNLGSVRADVVFDNFDNGGGFHPTNNAVAAAVAFIIPSPTIATRTAGQFTVSGSDYKLDSITLPISFQGAGANNTLRVRLTDDNAGVPGATLEVLSLNQNIWPTISTPFTTKTTLTSVTHPTLSHGTNYWIVMELTSIVNANENVDYRWFVNTSGTTVPYRQQQAVNAGLPADPWSGAVGTYGLAFLVEGTPVPEPLGIALVGLGTVGFLAHGRRHGKVDGKES